MKQFLLILLIIVPVASFSQCPKWIGVPIDSVLLLEKITEKYLGMSLTEKIDRTHKSDIDFNSSSCSCEFFFTTSRYKKNKMKYKGASQIVINGPIANISKMFHEYFYTLIRPCASSANETQLIHDDISINYFTFKVRGKKIAQINIHKIDK